MVLSVCRIELPFPLCRRRRFAGLMEGKAAHWTRPGISLPAQHQDALRPWLNQKLRFDGSLVAEFCDGFDDLFAGGFIRVIINDRFTPFIAHLGGDHAGSALQHRLDPACATCATHPLYGDKYAISLYGACDANRSCRVFFPSKSY